MARKATQCLASPGSYVGSSYAVWRCWSATIIRWALRTGCECAYRANLPRSTGNALSDFVPRRFHDVSQSAHEEPRTIMLKAVALTLCGHSTAAQDAVILDESSPVATPPPLFRGDKQEGRSPVQRHSAEYLTCRSSNSQNSYIIKTHKLPKFTIWGSFFLGF